MTKVAKKEVKPKKVKKPMVPGLKSLRWKIAYIMIALIVLAFILVFLNHFGVINTY